MEPACTTEGYTLHRCSICGYECKDSAVSPLGHAFGEYVSNDDSTCTEDGTKTAKCIRCDATDTIEDAGSKVAHSYVDEVVAPTCTTDGYTIHKCSACSYEYKDSVVSATGHDYGEVQTVKATCTENGYTYHVCETCNNYEKIETLTKTGHTALIDAAKEATCTETGLTEGSHCGVCGIVLVPQTVIEKVDHVPSDWIADETVSCTTAREKHKICTVCNTIIEVATAEPEEKHDFVNGKCTRCLVTTYTKSGKTIYFGSYPQSQVTDSTLTASLTELAGTLPTSSNQQAWTNYGYYDSDSVSNYMWYIDKELNGEKYRGVYFTNYRPYGTDMACLACNSYQDDNGYDTDNVYWFEYEPIKWKVLSESDGNALIVSSIALDAQQYDWDSDNEYNDSDMRKWLNEEFYTSAFNDLEREIIQTTSVDNSLVSVNTNSNASYYNNGVNDFVCDNTEDKVFLLSVNEATNTAYGFKADPAKTDTDRKIKSSEYAYAQGNRKFSNEYCEWYLRSPYYGGNVIYMADNGATSNLRSCSKILGVVPALNIKL